MNEQDIMRINELAKIKKQRSLTEEEALERERLHKQYIEDMKASLCAHLDNMVIERPDGTRVKVQKKDDLNPPAP